MEKNDFVNVACWSSSPKQQSDAVAFQVGREGF
jgi:hypothetical protein